MKRVAPLLAVVLSLGAFTVSSFSPINSCPSLVLPPSLSLPLYPDRGRLSSAYLTRNDVDAPKSGRALTRFLLSAWRRIGTRVKQAQRTAAVVWMALTVLCISANSADAIPSAGRMGGSFGCGSSPSISAPSHRGSFGDGPLPPPGLYMRANQICEVGELPGELVDQPASPSANAVKVVDPVTYYVGLTAFYGLSVYSMNRSGKNKQKETALGSGASVMSLVVALDVSNRDDKSGILSRLRDISVDAQTSSRSGVQALISEVALELLRQRDTVTAACSTYMHCSGPTHADIEFKRMSTFERAKFGKETINVFNGAKAIEPADESMTNEDSQATSVVVSMLVSIEGDRTKVRRIISRRDLENALLRIAADSQVDDCLLSAEVLWTPEDRSVTLSNQDLVASYPELAVL